jgi:cell wall-associated NlpC family hydrolase
MVLGGVRLSYRQFLGIPYKFRGRDHRGTDCLGLVWMYLRTRGIFIPDTDGLAMEHDRQDDYMRRAMNALEKLGKPVIIPHKDDIVLMRMPGGYTHMGVMVDDVNILHVLKDRPSRIDPVRRFSRRITGIYRPYPDLEKDALES